MLWSGQRRDENPVMTFPIKKRIETEIFIGRNAALFIQNGGIKDMNKREGGQPFVLVDPQINHMLR